MSIEVRTGADGKPRYLVRIETVDEYGKRRRVRRGQFTNRREAERAEAVAFDKRDRGTLLEPDKITVSQLLDEWLAVKKTEVTLNTFTDYDGTVRKHIKPTLGSITMQRLTPVRIQAQYGKWGDAGLSPYVIRNCHICLLAACDFAVRMKLLAHNPVRDARPPKLQRSTFQCWNAEEARTFIDAAMQHYLFWSETVPPRWVMPLVMWDLLLREGMRRGEALGLRWRDINSDRGLAHIQQSVIQNKGGAGAVQVQPRTKTRAGDRTVRLTPETHEHLKVWRKDWAGMKLQATDWQDTDLIVCRPDGRPIDPSTVTRTFHDILAYAKEMGKPLPRIKIHELRHTSATLLLSAGVSPKVVSERLGHSSIAITLDVYSHVLPDLQETASDAMSRVLG